VEATGLGVDAGDYNNDSFLGIFLRNFSQDMNNLYRNTGDGTFKDVSNQSG